VRIWLLYFLELLVFGYFSVIPGWSDVAFSKLHGKKNTGINLEMWSGLDGGGRLPVSGSEKFSSKMRCGRCSSERGQVLGSDGWYCTALEYSYLYNTL